MPDTDETYEKGQRVVLIHTDDEATLLTPGTRGTVQFVDDIGTVHVKWDDGSRLGMAQTFGDEFRRLTPPELAEEQTTGEEPSCA